MLKIENLRVTYGNTVAVRDIAFEVRKGCVMALVGANGAGKTSTLNALTGLVSSRGQISLDDVDLHDLGTDQIVRLGVVQVAQGRQLFPEMSVQDNLELGAFLQTSEEKRIRLASIMNEFPLLRTRAGQLAGTLSGGEQQILAVARALMAGPKVLLLDEPCLGLAPVIVRQIASIIKRLNAGGLTILLAEQNAAFALNVSDHVLVMENGRVVVSGPTSELRHDTAIRRSYLGA